MSIQHPQDLDTVELVRQHKRLSRKIVYHSRNARQCEKLLGWIDAELKRRVAAARKVVGI